ncbi:hypothetical protein HMPREF0372_01450 [Flavonifractor plautii ATCC 29863]|uniref:Uncharacterized protein n=1 Tax=Flavonifractor plautii ATCC 29863 TaxID=411475 RepID=G9YPH1_FLAPL|nr:hypothetical protein HMPREF0372_01450 [Flavonifractor plautii ATCC 29863]
MGAASFPFRHVASIIAYRTRRRKGEKRPCTGGGKGRTGYGKGLLLKLHILACSV